MRPSIFTALLLWATLLAGPPTARCHEAPSHPEAGDGCVCPTARASNGWCDACGVGYLARLRVPSAMLYELIDAHGHDVDLSGVSCATCHGALATSGYCEEHGIGFFEGRAYVTRLAYQLARGEEVEGTGDYRRLTLALQLIDTCEFCALAAFGNGRCPKCDIHYEDGAPAADEKRESR